jgi:hypothetical protein
MSLPPHQPQEDTENKLKRTEIRHASKALRPPEEEWSSGDVDEGTKP